MKLSNLIGKSIVDLIGQPPFDEWSLEKSFEGELGEPMFHYEFPGRGLEFRCDENERVNVVFLIVEVFDHACEEILDFDVTMKRAQILDLFGPPSTHRGAAVDPLLGEQGAWDRFDFPTYSLHIEYGDKSDRIRKVTCMSKDFLS